MSEAVAASEAGDATSSNTRRKSGRVTKKPEKFAAGASPTGSSKRKRGDDHDSGVDADESTSDEEDESTEGEPDEEELRERRRKTKSKAPAKRPAPKKAKTNGKSVTLAMRPATGAPKKGSRPRKAPIRKSILPQDEMEGLYGRHMVCI
jgi:cohesin complex subunit SA-1/2